MAQFFSTRNSIGLVVCKRANVDGLLMFFTLAFRDELQKNIPIYLLLFERKVFEVIMKT